MSRRPSFFQIVTIVALLSLGVWLRSAFGVGMNFDTSLSLSKDAWRISFVMNERDNYSSQSATSDSLEFSFAQLRAEMGLRKFLLLSPVSLLYTLFGVNDITASFLPMLAAVLLGSLIFTFVQLGADYKTALLCVFLWAIFPGDVFLSSALALDQLYAAFLVGSSICAFSLSINRRLYKVLLLIIMVVFLLLFHSLYFLIAIVLVCTILFKEIVFSRAVLIGVTVVATGLFVLNLFEISSVFVNWFLTLTMMPETTLVFPLLLVCLVGLWNLREKSWIIPFSFVWFFCSLLYSILGAYICSSTSLWCTGSLRAEGQIEVILPLIVPMILLIGNYLSIGLSLKKASRNILLLATMAFFIYWIISTMPPGLIDDYTKISVLTRRNLLYFSNIGASILFVVSLLIPLIMNVRESKWKNILIFLVVGLFGLTTVGATWQRYEVTRFTIPNLREALTETEGKQINLPIEVNSQHILSLLEFVSGYSSDLGIGPRLRFQSSEMALENIENSYFIIERHRLLRAVPFDWWQISEYYNATGEAITLYQDLNQSDAIELINNINHGETQSSETKDNHELVGLLTNAGDLCEAQKAWMFEQVHGGTDYYKQFNETALCLEVYAPLQEFSRPINLLESNMIIGVPDTVSSGPSTFSGSSETIQIYHYYDFFADWRNFDIKLRLDIDSFYLFSADIQSFSPAIAHYLRVGEQEWFLGQQSYSDWENVAILFSTYNRDFQDFEVSYSPILVDNFQRAGLANWSVAKVKFPLNIP